MTTVALIGAGNMSRAIARGWRLGDGGPAELMICDAGSGRAAALASETGATPLSEAREAFQRADVAVVATKPASLDSVAEAADGFQGIVVSLLAGTDLPTVSKAFPEARCVRVMPNVAVEKRQGVLCWCGSDDDHGDHSEIAGLFSVLGLFVEVPEALFDAATAIMGCGPAYVALVAEALADAGVKAGLGEQNAATMVAQTLAGTASLLEDRDTLSVRRAVTSPGGSTAAGLAVLERGAVRAAFAEAVAASIARMQE